MLIRPWRTGDETLAGAATAYLSVTSLTNRFLAGTGGRLPAAYVRHIAIGPRPTWDAYVAEGDGHLIGWAEFGRVNATSPEADLAVIVADPWHRQGIASAMIRALLPVASHGHHAPRRGHPARKHRRPRPTAVAVRRPPTRRVQRRRPPIQRLGRRSRAPRADRTTNSVGRATV